MMIQTRLERKDKMTGRWKLARMRTRKDMKKERWLSFTSLNPPLPQIRTSTKIDQRLILGTLRRTMLTSPPLLPPLISWMPRTYSSSATRWATGSWRTSGFQTLSKS